MGSSGSSRTYVEKQGDWYHYRREVPREYRNVDPRRNVRQALKTKDRAHAIDLAKDVDKRVVAYWASLANSQSTHTGTKFRAAMDLASHYGVPFRPFDEVMQLPKTDFVDRAAILADAGAGDKTRFQALYGTVKTPKIPISNLLDEYEKLAKEELAGKSDDQMRVWRNPRKKAIANWCSVVGDTDVAELDQYKAMSFRDWWLDRVDTDGIKPSSANKDLSHLAKMSRDVCRFHRIASSDPFRGMMLREEEEPEKHPFSRDFVTGHILRPGALDTMNAEARALVLIVASTGARPSEVAALPGEFFHLDDNIPYVEITPHSARKLKTKYSKRVIPLCGSALTGARMLLGLSSRGYLARTSSLSATVNKYFSEHGLRETPEHSFYSFRHTFQDGLTALEVPDRIQTELMGHKFDRPVYGKGPTLAHKLTIVDRLAFC